MQDTASIIITGGSATGKSTLAKMLVTDAGFVQYKPYTTRSRRENEDVSDYRHMSQYAFKSFQNAQELLFSDELHNNFYGVGFDAIEHFSENAKALVILPTWRVKEFQLAVQKDCHVFHVVNTDIEIASRRMATQKTNDPAARLSDLVIQNSSALVNAIKIDASLPFEKSYQIIKNSVGLY